MSAGYKGLKAIEEAKDAAARVFQPETAAGQPEKPSLPQTPRFEMPEFPKIQTPEVQPPSIPTPQIEVPPIKLQLPLFP